MQQPSPQQPPAPVLPPGYEIRKKGHFWRNAGIGCAGLIVLFIIIGIAAGSGSHSNTPTSSSPATTAAPAAAKVLLDKTGSGINQTPKFTTSGDWEIDWSYDCSNFGSNGNFVITVYSGDGTLHGIAANQLGAKGSDVSNQHQGGTYYLEMNSECDWHVIVKG